MIKRTLPGLLMKLKIKFIQRKFITNGSYVSVIVTILLVCLTTLPIVMFIIGEYTLISPFYSK